MTTFFLIRHAANDLVGHTLAGRMPGVHLNALGRQQAEGVAELLARAPIHQIFSGPLERAQETAQFLAKRMRLEVQTAEALGEIDFGDWTGLTLEQLAPVRQWQLFNSFRSGTRVPRGELALESQARMVVFLDRLRQQFPDQTLALVSHGDVIKAAVAYYLGIPLDLFQRLEISPASVSALVLEDYGPQILYVNRVAENAP
ncbi:MAG: histidine phosphatase family protein [Planctomycetes bacterium]|nr:histidine phosphatase family protein [Planctomycetota bacterium]